MRIPDGRPPQTVTPSFILFNRAYSTSTVGIISNKATQTDANNKKAKGDICHRGYLQQIFETEEGINHTTPQTNANRVSRLMARA